MRGSLECPDFTEIVFILDLLELLDVDMGDSKKAMAQGWDLDKFQIRIINLKDRFTTPTSGGWADAMVNFSFVHGDDTHHVMELQLQVLSFVTFPSLTLHMTVNRPSIPIRSNFLPHKFIERQSDPILKHICCTCTARADVGGAKGRQSALAVQFFSVSI